MADGTSEPNDDFDDDGDVDINLRPPAEVAARVIVLASVCRLAFSLARRDPHQALSSDLAAEAYDLHAWLRLEGLDDAIVPSERRVLEPSAASLAAPDLQAATWRTEALAALGWALGLLPELPSVALPVDPAPLFAAIPDAYDATAAFRRRGALRDETRIAIERERAELWHWRADVELLQTDATGRERSDLAQLVRDVAIEAAAGGLLPQPVGDDFNVDGRAFRALTNDEREQIGAIAEQRHHAFNWLCGFGDDWDGVPLDL